MLNGSLDDFTLPDIFRLMSFAKKTGRLDVVRSAGEGNVFFRDGEVYFAESSISKEPLGQKLMRARALSEGQLMKALDEHKASGRRLGEVLVATGLVSNEQLEGAVRQQVEDAVFDLLRWELGEFHWEPGAELDVEVPISVSVENLIMEASRRLDEFEVIKRKIPSEQTVLGMAPTPPEGAVEINITPDEWRILVLVDGNRPVADIGQRVGLDSFAAMRVLYGLVSAGLIEVVDGSVPAVEELETVADVAVERELEPQVEPAGMEEPAAAEAIETPIAEVVEAAPEPATADVVEPALEPAAEEEPPVVVEEIPSEAEVVPSEQPVMEVVEAEAEAQPEPVSNEVLADPLGDLGVSGELSAEELEQFGITPPVAAPSDESDAAWTEAPEVSSFDTPGPDELVTETPAPDPFAADLFGEPAPVAPEDEPLVSDEDVRGAPQAPPAPEAPQEEIPVSSAPSGEAPVVDRAAVARELAGLFDDDIERPRARPSSPRPAATKPAAAPGKDDPGDTRKRVEDDDEVTKGIISRLIDGVKGL